MLRQLIDRTPEKYRFLGFLVITSIIGVALILLAVYNASRELERRHVIDTLHDYAAAWMYNGGVADDEQSLRALSAPGYRFLIISDDRILADSDGANGREQAVELSGLEDSRLSERGGYLERDEGGLAWIRLPLRERNAELIVLHEFESRGMEPLLQVYTRRLLIPAGFYIWLMVWMAFILSHLTGRLSRQKREMEHMALHDSLSGLPNRNLLNDRLNKLIEMSKRHHGHFALAMIDLDGFKSVNDTMGHDVGDALLREIARRLSGSVRSVDTVARVGGDEFVLLLDDLGRAGALDICRRAAGEMMRPVSIRGNEVQVGASIGIAVFPQHGDNPESLIRNADLAMYAVKAAGGGIRLYLPPTSSGRPVQQPSSAVSV